MNFKLSVMTGRFLGATYPAMIAASDFKEVFSKGLGIIMMIAFIVGVIIIIGGALAIKKGNTDEGKMAIIAGVIIAAAGGIMGFLMEAGGNKDAMIDAEF